MTGGTSAKEKKAALSRITETPAGRPLTLVATGKYIGEGFDEPRLDTLFLAMPISWKGTVQQYAGRLHRLFESKENVRSYDYVDTSVKILSEMYNKRLAGYASLGYKVRAEKLVDDSVSIIFDHRNFLPIYETDLRNARKKIMIVSPFVTNRRVLQMTPFVTAALQKDVKVEIMTRPAIDYKEIKWAPQLMSYMKIRVEEHRDKMGAYVFTGSPQFTMIKNLSDSLAGRIAGFAAIAMFIVYRWVPKPAKHIGHL